MCSSDRTPVSDIRPHNPIFYRASSKLTTKTIFPRSPVTLRCRLVISSRYGITTVQPAPAVDTHFHQYISRSSDARPSIPSLLTMYLPSCPDAPKTVTVCPGSSFSLDRINVRLIRSTNLQPKTYAATVSSMLKNGKNKKHIVAIRDIPSTTRGANYWLPGPRDGYIMD